MVFIYNTDWKWNSKTKYKNRNKKVIKWISINSVNKADIVLFSHTTNQLVTLHILSVKHPCLPPSLMMPNPPPTHPTYAWPCSTHYVLCSCTWCLHCSPSLTNGTWLWTMNLMMHVNWFWTLNMCYVYDCIFYTGFHCSLSVCYMSGRGKHWSVAYS